LLRTSGTLSAASIASLRAAAADDDDEEDEEDEEDDKESLSNECTALIANTPAPPICFTFFFFAPMSNSCSACDVS
jgi:hypothetical protein